MAGQHHGIIQDAERHGAESKCAAQEVQGWMRSIGEGRQPIC